MSVSTLGVFICFLFFLKFEENRNIQGMFCSVALWIVCIINFISEIINNIK